MITQTKIRLIQNYYQADPERQQELLYTVKANTANRYISEHVILAECNLDLPYIPINSRPTFNTFVSYINAITRPDDINIIANSDIYFDGTITLTNKLKSNNAYAISRQDTLQSEDNRAGLDTQDCWVFRGKIKKLKANFALGILGCDNRLLWLMRDAGYTVTNPCHQIKLWHVHKKNAEDLLTKRSSGIVIQGPYGWVEPE